MLVKSILLHIGFTTVASDGLYIFDGSAGQMIQGLAEAHNADVLLEPPVQTPFYSPTRLLIECKDYKKKVGLPTLRGALGLREDINHFDIVDRRELEARRRNRRSGLVYPFRRYSYQVAVASMSGFTAAAQNFAATHRIPLIEFNKMPFWMDFCEALGHMNRHSVFDEDICDERIWGVINQIAGRCAVGITNQGQMLFLYRKDGSYALFDDDYYSLHWTSPSQPWTLRTGGIEYQFQLPENLLKLWLDQSSTDMDRRVNAINCKMNFLSSMVVYYSHYQLPKIAMISINERDLQKAIEKLNG